MGQQPADVEECRLTEAAVAIGIVKEVLSFLEQVLVKVHAVAGLAVERLGHKGRRLAAGVGCHLGHVFDQHGRVAGGHQAHHRRLDLDLTRAADFVVVVLDRHAHRFQVQGYLGPQVVELILGGNGVVAAVQWDVVAVAAFGTLPVGLPRVHPVAGPIHTAFVGHIVKDIELELWPPAALVGDAGLVQTGLGAEGDVAWVVGKDGLGVRL